MRFGRRAHTVMVTVLAGNAEAGLRWAQLGGAAEPPRTVAAPNR
jgi:hypothetical protein